MRIIKYNFDEALNDFLRMESMSKDEFFNVMYGIANGPEKPPYHKKYPAGLVTIKSGKKGVSDYNIFIKSDYYQKLKLCAKKYVLFYGQEKCITYHSGVSDSNEAINLAAIKRMSDLNFRFMQLDVLRLYIESLNVEYKDEMDEYVEGKDMSDVFTHYHKTFNGGKNGV